jgi:DNA-binding transcriptional LysR family regulator
MPRTDGLDWDDVRFFLNALESKSLAGAARSLGVEHTTVGRRISSLERTLGATLVARKPEGLEATALGEKVAQLARDMRRSARAIEELVKSQQARVRISTPSGFTRLFGDKVGELRRQHPEIILDFSTEARHVDLLRGEADIAVRVGPVAGDDLLARKVCDMGWSLYASESYLATRASPVDPHDLTGHAIIGYDAGVLSLPAAQWMEARAANATVILRSREMTEMTSAAVSGLGIALLPCLLADREPTLRQLTPEVLATRSVSIVYRRDAIDRDEMREVVRFVADVLRDNADLIAGTRKRSTS